MRKRQIDTTTFNRLSAICILLGAFLLFQVQPVISKAILPWFGGSPSVWTTCMLFFQVLLVGGYCYAHWLGRPTPLRHRVLLHIVLLAIGCSFLPIIPSERWRPDATSDAALQILLLLTVCIGLPYFLLATTGPLVQSWYGVVNPDRSPYRLYALSNFGSFAALITFPFIVEPGMTTSEQAWTWSIGFVLFAGAYGWLTWIRRKHLSGNRTSASKGTNPASDEGQASVSMGWRQRGCWLVLPAFAVVALLAVTNYVCQDVAVVPFLWVAPLSLYLLSFVICFEFERWYSRKWYGLATMIAVLLVSNAQLARWLEEMYGDVGIRLPFQQFFDSILVRVVIFMAAFFLLCMVCHGELVRRKPERRFLTSFYLFISIGGALGGVGVAILCPLLFNEYLEMNLVLVLGFLLSVAAMMAGARTTWYRRYRLAWPLSIGVAIVGFVVVLWAQYESLNHDAIVKVRNFYGTLHVKADAPLGLGLYHGTIQHGYQHAHPARRNEPTTYYTRDSGVGLALEHFPRPQDRGLTVFAVGLGTGTVAAYGKVGDRYRFYEINPAVVELAEEYFSFLRDSPATIQIELGDARLSMEEEPDHEADVIILDAFSGDAIPVHLLTMEAFATYLRVLKPDGVLCVHVSNRHLDLTGVVVRLTQAYGLPSYWVETEEYGDGAAPSTWILVTGNEAARSSMDEHGTLQKLRIPPNQILPLWTDQHCSLWSILR